MALEDDVDASVDAAEILQGRQVLDVGCGGGLLSEVRTQCARIHAGLRAILESGTSRGPYNWDRRLLI